MAASERCAPSAERGAPGPCAVADDHPRGDVSPGSAAREVSGRGEDVIGRLFGSRIINDGTGMILLELPRLVRREADAPLSVQVNWSLVLTKAVARLYLIADGNRNALLTSVSLIPDLVPPHVCVNVRLDGSTDVRAVVECGDGTLLQAKRWVRVMPHDQGALPAVTSTPWPMLIGDGRGIGRGSAGTASRDGITRRAPDDEENRA